MCLSLYVRVPVRERVRVSRPRTMARNTPRDGRRLALFRLLPLCGQCRLLLRVRVSGVFFLTVREKSGPVSYGRTEVACFADGGCGTGVAVIAASSR